MTTGDRLHSLVIAGEVYSPNLGDGVIAECLAFLLRRVSPGLSVSLLDISGRSPWPTPPGPIQARGGRPLYRQLASIPRLRRALRLVRWFAVKRPRYVRLWQPALAGASRLVIGGGQLLMDDGLNFPLKVNAVAGVARRRGIDLHVSACGVGARWSGMAHTLFSRTLSEARTITVRDASSLERLNRFLPGLPSPPRLTFDPAIWAAEVYGQPEGPAGDRPPFGLGLLGLHEVNSYAPPGGAFTAESLVQFWLDVLAGLRREGVAFELFTNGTDSDYLFARQVCREAQARLAFEPDLNDRPFWPRELAHQVSRYQAVLSSRLHGGIIALSYGIPAAGLAWDDKVKSFYAATGRSEFCVSIYDRNPDALVKALQLAAREGVDPGAVVRWKERALENAAVVLGSGAL